MEKMYKDILTILREKNTWIKIIWALLPILIVYLVYLIGLSILLKFSQCDPFVIFVLIISIFITISFSGRIPEKSLKKILHSIKWGIINFIIIYVGHFVLVVMTFGRLILPFLWDVIWFIVFGGILGSISGKVDKSPIKEKFGRILGRIGGGILPIFSGLVIMVTEKQMIEPWIGLSVIIDKPLTSFNIYTVWLILYAFILWLFIIIGERLGEIESLEINDGRSNEN